MLSAFISLLTVVGVWHINAKWPSKCDVFHGILFENEIIIIYIYFHLSIDVL